MPRQRLGKREMRRRLSARQWRRSILSFRPKLVASNRYENCFSLSLVRDHSKRFVHPWRQNYIRRLGKQVNADRVTAMSVREYLDVRSLFTRVAKKYHKEELIESFSLDGGSSYAVKIFFFPFPFSKIFSDFPPQIESHPLIRVPAATGRTSIQPSCNVSGPFHARVKSHSHTIEAADLRGERSDTQEKRDFWTQGGCVKMT